MTKRRIILLSAVCVLAAVYIVQLALSLRSPQKTFKINETITYISIENSGQTVVAQKNGGSWFSDGELLDETKVGYLAEILSNIKTLSVASSASDPATLERYGFDKKITVRARAEGADVCSLLIGKESVSGSQAYIQFEGRKEIYLAQGNFRRDFSFKPEDLKKKEEAEQTAPQIIEDTH